MLFYIKLSEQPLRDVKISIKSENILEGAVVEKYKSIDIKVGDWNKENYVLVKGVNDDKQDGVSEYEVSIVSSSEDPKFDSLSASITISNEDNDTSYLIISDKNIVTSEYGDSLTSAISLSSEPEAGVSVLITSDSTEEGQFSPSTMEFNASNWDQSQLVTIIGEKMIILMMVTEHMS